LNRLQPPGERAGLTPEAARQRLSTYGLNEITRSDGISPWAILAGQFKGAMIWLLVGACALSAALGETSDAIAILRS